MIVVRAARPEEAEPTQKICLEPQNSKFLGGLIYLSEIEGRIASNGMCITYDEDEQKISGMCAVSRKHNHRMELVLTAISKSHVRGGHAEATYAFWIVNSILEGRYQLQDHIIGDNFMMPFWLPTVSFKRSVCQISKVRRHHALSLWTLDVREKWEELKKWMFSFDPQNWCFEVTLDPWKFDNFQTVSSQLESRERYEEVREMTRIRTELLEILEAKNWLRS